MGNISHLLLEDVLHLSRYLPFLIRINEFETSTSKYHPEMPDNCNPKNVKTHFLIASCLLLRGESLDQQSGGREKARTLFSEAVTAANETLALHPEHGLTHVTRGWALKHLGRTEEALMALRRAVDIQPDFADAHLYLGETLAEAGRLYEALPHLQNSVRFARPGDARPSEALARLRAKLNTAPKNEADAFESQSKKKPL